ncbi:MAG: DnaJ C-terminal domain-containing protein [Candidatus Alcyoniella australis]|nr:DnaJ C-terminal domain-containing protein [Candidatus Alcyoniella australis]
MSPSLQQLYQTLKIRPGATQAEIKSAYRRLARQLHPDLAGDDPRMRETFQKVQLAYDILYDPEKRVAFETSVEAARLNAEINRFARRAGTRVGQTIARFKRGRREAARRSSAGRDLLYRLEVELTDLAADSFHSLAVDRPGPCPDCDGRDETEDRECAHCQGTGRCVEREHLPVRVPGGTADGARLRICGKGERSTEPGDLVVEVRVKPDERFALSGLDVLSRQQILFTSALSGGTVQVQTIHGPQTIELPKAMASGKSFRLKGKGLPDLHGEADGDHVVELNYRVPRLTDEQIEQLLCWERQEEIR